MVAYPTFFEGPPCEPLWQMPRGRPREVAIFCAEELRPSACVVADALVVRGYLVSLESGANARSALQLSLQSARRGLRVLCVPHALDRKTQRMLYAGLDGDLRGDLLVVPLETPRAVIEAVEARNGVKRARPRRRFTRAYLPHATIVESRSDVGRYAGYGLVAAAVIAMVALVFESAMPSSSAAMVAATTPAAMLEPEPRSLLLDDAVLGATVPPEVDFDDEPPSRRWRRRAKEVSRLRAELAVAMAEPEEIIVIEDDEDPPRPARPIEPAPLEELADEPASIAETPPTFGHGEPGLPTRRSRSMPVDPFAE